ncbi:helix-turn-helix domain-containing protein [Streptomyces spinoverrucosus]|uniref:LuxR C-terminal-related transcriptional regulator n=1 Tax=Streptomyces spinoverrucosus TaxID=284043 RepID=UPI0018C378A4|nr:LuxR C-terminal-related transcriptional regulator [Streptomyces spinoverrucosus]MBG0852322.1 helix-turn-helix domain-containing protein [Streptomyces spinoverrucosus]
MLNALGLDIVTEAVYRGMLAHPEDGAAELRERLDLTEDAVRAALNQLSEMALIRPASGDEQRMHVVGPHVAVEILLARQQAELAAQQQRLEESRAAAVRLLSESAGRDPGSPGDEVEHLKGLDDIRDHLAEMNRTVESELMAFAPGGPQTPDNMRSSRPLTEHLLGRGVSVRTTYLDSIRNDPATVAHAEWLTSVGVQVRTVPTLPNRMIIADRRVAVIATDSDETAQGAVVLRTPGVLATLCSLFETVWQTARPLGAGTPPSSSDDLTPQQREALRLLAQGATDETIAKRLGVSPRTARRISTGLMTHLDARSRFQAGVHAARRGLVSD